MTASEPFRRPAEAEETPDAIDHFWAAVHEALSAARAVLDAADAVVEQQRTSRKATPSQPRVRRIDVE